jgi:drug/metabolite transporter (DMT)-like permease
VLKNIRHEAFLIGGSLFFALNSVPAKLVMESGISPFRLTQIRISGAFLLMFLYVFIRNRKGLRVTRAELPMLIAFGVIGFAVVNGLYFAAIERLNVSIALIIEFSAPIWIVIWMRFIKKRNVSKLMWSGLSIGFTGLLLVGQVWRGLTLDGVGLIFAFVDAFALSFYFVVGERFVKAKGSEVTMVLGFGVSTAFFAIVLPWWSFPFEVFSKSIELTGRFSGNSLPGWLLILWVIIGGTAVPYFLVLTGLKGLNAATSSVIGMLEPVFGGVLAWFFLFEKLTLTQFIGSCVVLVGIYLADRARTSI